VSCSAEKLFIFVTDIRNFERFIPPRTISNWEAEKESCSFNVSMLGTVSVKITGSEKFKSVVYNGDAFKKDDFELVLHITDNSGEPAEVKVSVSAELNPVMKMMAATPIAQFLEMLINEMEKFSGWDEIKEGTRPL